MGERKESFTGHWLAIVLLTVTGLLLLRAAYIRDPGLHVSPMIAYLCAAIFLVGAFVVLQQVVGAPTRGHGAAVLILAALTIIGGWIALSPGAGGCSIGVGDGPGTRASGLTCRVPFGIGALICGAMTVSVAISWIRMRRGKSSGSNRAGSPRV